MADIYSRTTKQIQTYIQKKEDNLTVSQNMVATYPDIQKMTKKKPDICKIATTEYYFNSNIIQEGVKI